MKDWQYPNGKPWNYGIACKIFGHYHIYPSPQTVQCRRCGRYKDLVNPVEKEVYAKVDASAYD